MKIKNEAGEEIDVLTQEEADALVAQKAAEVEAAKQAELDNLAAEKATIEEELGKFRNKDYNFEALRNKAENKGKTEEELKKQIEDINKRLESVAQQPILDTKADFVRMNIGDDKEKSDLFEYYYKKLGADAKTRGEVIKASQEALALATNGAYKPGDGNAISTGISHNYRDESKKETSETSKAIGSLLGITEEDRKKYGKKGTK